MVVMSAYYVTYLFPVVKRWFIPLVFSYTLSGPSFRDCRYNTDYPRHSDRPILTPYTQAYQTVVLALCVPSRRGTLFIIGSKFGHCVVILKACSRP